MDAYHELICTIQFKEDMPVRLVQSNLAALISNGMLFDQRLKELHGQNRFKPYTFCLPYPRENDRIYQKSRIYCFNMRSSDLNFAIAIKNFLPKVKGNIRVIATELRTYTHPHVKELVCLTPVICTVDNRCWMPENGIALLAERLHVNAVKKCKAVYTEFEEPEEYFYELIEILNQKPIVVDYNGTTLIGHKVQLKIKPQPWSQKLALIVLGQGLGEKGALGFGYCLARR